MFQTVALGLADAPGDFGAFASPSQTVGGPLRQDWAAGCKEHINTRPFPVPLGMESVGWTPRHSLSELTRYGGAIRARSGLHPKVVE